MCKNRFIPPETFAAAVATRLGDACREVQLEAIETLAVMQKAGAPFKGIFEPYLKHPEAEEHPLTLTLTLTLTVKST